MYKTYYFSTSNLIKHTENVCMRVWVKIPVLFRKNCNPRKWKWCLNRVVIKTGFSILSIVVNSTILFHVIRQTLESTKRMWFKRYRSLCSNSMNVDMNRKHHFRHEANLLRKLDLWWRITERTTIANYSREKLGK